MRTTRGEVRTTTFSLKDPPVSVVRKLLAKLNERKAAGLDNIPSGLLKMSGNIIAPSLTQLFIKSINTNIFPTEWKLARLTPIFKKDKRETRTIIDQYPLFRPLPKFSKKSYTTSFVIILRITTYKLTANLDSDHCTVHSLHWLKLLIVGRSISTMAFLFYFASLSRIENISIISRGDKLSSCSPNIPRGLSRR